MSRSRVSIRGVSTKVLQGRAMYYNGICYNGKKYDDFTRNIFDDDSRTKIANN